MPEDDCPPCCAKCQRVDLFILWSNMIVLMHIEIPVPDPKFLGPYA